MPFPNAGPHPSIKQWAIWRESARQTYDQWLKSHPDEVFNVRDLRIFEQGYMKARFFDWRKRHPLSSESLTSS